MCVCGRWQLPNIRQEERYSFKGVCMNIYLHSGTKHIWERLSTEWIIESLAILDGKGGSGGLWGSGSVERSGTKKGGRAVWRCRTELRGGMGKQQRRVKVYMSNDANAQKYSSKVTLTCQSSISTYPAFSAAFSVPYSQSQTIHI